MDYHEEIWKPAKAKLSNTLDHITEPPCKHCKFFTPRAVTDKVGGYYGISLCSAASMHRDFSCFEDKAKVKG